MLSKWRLENSSEDTNYPLDKNYLKLLLGRPQTIPSPPDQSKVKSYNENMCLEHLASFLIPHS